MQSDIGDYPSRMGDRASRHLGTFSYLPPLDETAVRCQIDRLVTLGLEPAIEHVEPERATARYWYLWKLPLFGERDPEVITAEIAACTEANPLHHVRLVGYDTVRQTEAMAFVVRRAMTTA